MKIYAPVSNPCSEELCLLCSIFLSFVFVRGRVIFSYGTFKWTSSSFFPPVDFRVHNRLNLFFLPYACWVLIYITGGYKPECELWSYLCARSAWKMKYDFSSLKTMEGLKSFCTHSEQPGSQMVHCRRTRGSPQGQQGLPWSDCKIGTGVRCEGYKCKHTWRKWVTIPTLLLAHCASPRILETDAKIWPLCAFGSLNKQMLPWQFLAGFCSDLLFKRAWCWVCVPVTEMGFVLGLTVPGRSTSLPP